MPCCVLVNVTQSVQNILDIRDAMVSAFHQLCAKGPLAGQRLRGVRFDIVDAKIHSDRAHLRAQQLVPMGSRALTGAMLAASPRLLEPRFVVTVQSPPSAMKKVLQVLAARAAEVQAVLDGSVEALLSVRKSFGLVGDLRGETSGRSMLTTMPGGWGLVADEESESVIAGVAGA